MISRVVWRDLRLGSAAKRPICPRGASNEDRVPEVASSVISRIDYNAEARALHVTFASGRIYIYSGVPGEVYFQFCRAASKGEFFNTLIRDRYAFTEQR